MTVLELSEDRGNTSKLSVFHPYIYATHYSQYLNTPSDQFDISKDLKYLCNAKEAMFFPLASTRISAHSQ